MKYGTGLSVLLFAGVVDIWVNHGVNKYVIINSYVCALIVFLATLDI